MNHIYIGPAEVFVTHVVPDEGKMLEVILTDGKMSVGEIMLKENVELPIKPGVNYPSGIGYATGKHSAGAGAIYTRMVTMFNEIPRI